MLRVALFLALLLSLSLVAAGARQDRRGTTASRYTLTLDGKPAGMLKSFKGGGRFAEVVQEGGDPSAKQPGPPKFEDIIVELPVSSASAQQLLASMLAGQQARRSGSIVASSLEGNPISELQFTDALITEATFPACDAGTREPGYMTIRFTPEQIRSGKPGGKVAVEKTDATRAWTPSAFRLEIDGMDCKTVRRIEPLSVRLATANAAVGETRMPQKEAGVLQVPNLRFTVSEAAAGQWLQWFEDSVVKGQPMEKGGSLVLLAADLKGTVATIRFQNLGIIRVSPQPGTAERPGETVVELYCERMELTGP